MRTIRIVMYKSKFSSEAETYFAELLQRLGTDLPSQIMCEDEHGRAEKLWRAIFTKNQGPRKVLG